MCVHWLALKNIFFAFCAKKKEVQHCWQAVTQYLVPRSSHRGVNLRDISVPMVQLIGWATDLMSLLTSILGTPIPLYFALVGFSLWVIFSQQYIGRQPKDVLTSAEIDEMVAEFEPEPLGALDASMPWVWIAKVAGARPQFPRSCFGGQHPFFAYPLWCVCARFLALTRTFLLSPAHPSPSLPISHRTSPHSLQCPATLTESLPMQPTPCPGF